MSDFSKSDIAFSLSPVNSQHLRFNILNLAVHFSKKIKAIFAFSGGDYYISHGTEL
jgi:hypothetical protein